jgi:hypothetical protein
MPRSLSRRVRVRYIATGAEKDVLRSQLPLYGWERVTTSKKKKRPPAEAETSEPIEPAIPPDETTKEE